ncbi:MAG TPA: site-2 protease family protein [Anaerohalosphaeraceae bacterium]|nr:site-2 protease family protein [Anaerohalosphaeraceae bacterium]HOL88533.1 site-2 protease family protein [Anaerohalosphaeraceae bacterium]HPP56413.1 site-2 protease family protein [Anaerohalosphaeraceae bacterium]
MTDQPLSVPEPSDSAACSSASAVSGETKGSPQPPQSRLSNLLDLAAALAIVAAVIAFILRAPGIAGTTALVLLGFGGVIFVHELGHFLVAKLGGIKVEAFSIGFPPTILSIRKLKKGFRIRLFPRKNIEETLQEGDSETEYWLGLIPFGGFVKMLGQSDSGTAEKTDDPRSFANRPIWIRICVVAAGVLFNVLSAVILFMGLYLHGLDQQPAVVGGVVPNSPAEAAGFRPGDRIIAVNGKSFVGDFVDFSMISLAAALGPKGETTTFTVRHPDGRVERLKAVSELAAADTQRLRQFGIEPASTLEIPDWEEPEWKQQLTESGFEPGDVILAVDGKSVKTSWELKEAIRRSVKPEVNLTVQRKGAKPGEPLTTVAIPLEPKILYPNFRKEYDLANFYSLIPRLQVEQVFEPTSSEGFLQRILQRFSTAVLRRPVQKEMQPNPFKKGDILLQVADCFCPTFAEYRQAIENHKDKTLSVKVLRTDSDGQNRIVDISTRPTVQPGTKNRLWLGISLRFDMENPVVAQTLDTVSVDALPIPRGARIERVDGQPVKNFYEIAEIFHRNAGQQIGIDYRLSETEAGSAALLIPNIEGLMHVWSETTRPIPLTLLEEKAKTSNPAKAVAMGAKKTWYFIATTYLTLKGLFTRDVPTSALSGPVGILSISYQVAQESFIKFLYFMGLISACIAVMNLLPIPVVDGGVILFLLIEKIKGSPIPEKVQAGITYAGVVFLLAVFLWITYNDIHRIFFGS